MSEKNLETFSARLSFALNKLKMTQATLAKKINVNRQVIQYLCNSKNGASKFSYDIADALGISIDWLLSGTGSMMSEIKQKIVPILLKDQIRLWLKNELNEGAITEKTSVHENFSDLAFAFRLDDQAMFPRFDSNTIVVIEPLAEITAPCFVLVELKKTSDIIFRQLLKENNGLILSVYNEISYKSIRLSEEDLILGRMLEAKWSYF